jgi:hypothetical protein
MVGGRGPAAPPLTPRQAQRRARLGAAGRRLSAARRSRPRAARPRAARPRATSNPLPSSPHAGCAPLEPTLRPAPPHLAAPPTPRRRARGSDPGHPLWPAGLLRPGREASDAHAARGGRHPPQGRNRAGAAGGGRDGREGGGRAGRVGRRGGRGFKGGCQGASRGGGVAAKALPAQPSTPPSGCGPLACPHRRAPFAGSGPLFPTGHVARRRQH